MANVCKKDDTTFHMKTSVWYNPDSIARELKTNQNTINQGE